MKPLATFILRGRIQALTAIFGAGLLAIFFLPVGALSGAGVALTTLRRGVAEGALQAAAATLLTAIAALLLGGGGWLAPLLAGGFWLPALSAAATLRHTRSLALSARNAILLGVGLIGAFHLLMTGGPEQGWRLLLEQTLIPALGGGLGGAQQALLLDNLARAMTGGSASLLVLGALASLFIARAWQAALYNPGGFRREFHELRLERTVLLASVALLLPATLGEPPTLLRDLAYVALIGPMLQGAATLHAVVAIRKAHAGWLTAFYLLLLIAPSPTSLALALFGACDPWLDMRARLRARIAADR